MGATTGEYAGSAAGRDGPARRPLAASTARGPRGWLPVYEYRMRVYRRVWRGSLGSRILSPLLFLLAMGLGLGSLVDKGSGGIPHAGVVTPYLLFIVPAIIASQAMFTAMGESTWPVLGAIRWSGVFYAMLASPLRVVDVVRGHFAFVATQLTMATAIFMAVSAAFGGFRSWLALLCLPVSVLTGMAFTTLVTAFSGQQESDTGFNVLFRLVMTPLMLFSGTFFPIEALPVWLRPAAWVTPLWHGVEANRALSLGQGSAVAVLGHVVVLVAFCAGGWWLAVRSFRGRLVV